jgi:hypothetical protein
MSRCSALLGKVNKYRMPDTFAQVEHFSTALFSKIFYTTVQTTLYIIQPVLRWFINCITYENLVDCLYHNIFNKGFKKTSAEVFCTVFLLQGS